ncbi:hypothetical protein ZHAS_00018526 [Anopheles sinensis]|uniref:Uncharacterized protein n=1 Tax=Anopheles sinensis TaxID=74873 RepID=A0A084WJU5_ANOSI|nr:hypothetical protein ZHAS_00018526 [Anopheles sinensis]
METDRTTTVTMGNHFSRIDGERTNRKKGVVAVYAAKQQCDLLMMVCLLASDMQSDSLAAVACTGLLTSEHIRADNLG